MINAPILVICKTLQNVVASAAKSENSSVFINTQIALPIRHVLESLGHLQPPMRIQSDNSTTTSFVNNNIHQKRSKSRDMQFHLLRNKETQKKIQVY